MPKEILTIKEQEAVAALVTMRNSPSPVLIDPDSTVIADPNIGINEKDIKKMLPKAKKLPLAPGDYIAIYLQEDKNYYYATVLEVTEKDFLVCYNNGMYQKENLHGNKYLTISKQPPHTELKFAHEGKTYTIPGRMETTKLKVLVENNNKRLKLSAT